MSQGSWGGGGGGGGGGWGGGGYGPPPAGGWGPPPQGSGGYGPPQGGGGGYGPPPGGGGGGGGYGPPGGGGYGQGPSGFAPQPAGFPPGYSPPGGGGRGVPWEDSSLSFFSRWWGTVREALFNPRPFFASAAQSDDPWPAVTFSMLTAGAAGLILGVLAGLMYLAFGSILAAVLSSLGGSSGSGTPGAAAIVGIMGVLGIGVAIMYPLMFAFFGLVVPFVSGGIYHVTLSIFGGTTKSYMHTVRVVGYSHASYFWMMIPVPGLASLAAGAFSLICMTVGLDETHKCGIGKALLAIFLVPAVCCLCWCGLQGSLAAIGASAAP